MSEVQSQPGKLLSVGGKAMAKEWAKAFYNSTEWKVCREIYRARARGLCERCLKRGIVKPGEIVHHKTYLTPQNISDPSVTLNHNNLELVCRECHEAEHRGLMPRRWAVGEDGTVAIV